MSKDKAFVQNPADEEQVKEGGKKEQFRLNEQMDALRAVLATREGRKTLWWILARCRVHALSAEMESPNRTYFNEGQRNIGLQLQGMITEADPKAFITMMEEVRREKDE